MKKKHYVIIMPGLGDHDQRFVWLTKHWEQEFGLIPYVHKIPWEARNESFDEKLVRLKNRIDTLRGKEQHNVSIIGASAAGSFAFNALLAFPQDIVCAVNLCGRLTSGSEKGFRSFASRAGAHPAFGESVTRFEKAIPNISPAMKKRMLITKGWFDELVPEETMTISGIRSIRIPLIEHGICIMVSLVTFPKLGQFAQGRDVARFIRSNKCNT